MRFYVVVSQFSHYHLDSFIIYVRGCSFTRGSRTFLRRPRGGPEFFCACGGGGPEFFAHVKGGPEKKWQPAITNRRPPLPVKNDGSLKSLLIFSFFTFNNALWDRLWAKPCFSFLPVSPLIMVQFQKFYKLDLSEWNGPQAWVYQKDLICVILTWIAWVLACLHDIRSGRHVQLCLW